jgi:sulfotransferase family protein
MNRFFLITRGRTGSTAVIDELGKASEICTAQELFLKYKFGKKEDWEYHYDIIMPFDVWRTESWWRRLPPSTIYSDSAKAEQYLKASENSAKRRGAKSFGFKALSSNFEERPFLGSVLKQRGYKAIYLTRNLARQVLSGMVANQSGLWNTKENVEETGRYYIDLDQFQMTLKGEVKATEIDYALLNAKGFSFIVVSYEDFCTNRESFYEKIFHFLGLPTVLPPRSDWSVIIKDLRSTIANFDAVAKRAAEIGMPLDS